jgi:hypothetical protein
MSTYKMITVVGTSKDSIEAAIQGGVADAARSLRHLDWFEVQEMRGRLGTGGRVEEWQVKLQVGFRLDRGED